MNGRILVFEDDKAHQRTYTQLLEQAGYQVFIINHCRASEEADQIRQFNPGLVVVDSWFKSKVDGLEVVKDLRDLCPEVPIVVCTVLANDPEVWGQLLEDYRSSGVRRILRKEPFPTVDALLSL